MNHHQAVSTIDATGIEWIDATRMWLARFPLSIIQLAGRIGVGATFFKAGLLKYQSWEFTVRLFQEEYRVPLLDPAFAARARKLADKTYELTQFLRDVAKWDGVTAAFAKLVTYHESCSSLRELQVKRQPRELLAKVGGLSFKELPNGEPCCGFGGTFCVKFPDISNRMVEDKVANIAATGADVVLAADMGCLLNIAGKLKRAGSTVEARHVAEVLAGMADDAAIGEGQ